MLAVLLHQGQNARRHDPMRFAKVVVDLCALVSNIVRSMAATVGVCAPCNVRVMDCSSFSSSSVSDRLRAATLDRAIVDTAVGEGDASFLNCRSRSGVSVTCRFSRVETR